MSWNLRSYYACLTLQAIASESNLDDLLARFADNILPELRQDPYSDLWDAFDRDQRLIYADNPIRAMVKRIRDFLSEIDVQEGAIGLSLLSQEDSGAKCDAMVEALVRFLLPYAVEQHVMLRTSIFDGRWVFSNESFYRRVGNQIIVSEVPTLLKGLMAAPPHLINALLDAAAA